MFAARTRNNGKRMPEYDYFRHPSRSIEQCSKISSINSSGLLVVLVGPFALFPPACSHSTIALTAPHEPLLLPPAPNRPNLLCTLLRLLTRAGMSQVFLALPSAVSLPVRCWESWGRFKIKESGKAKAAVDGRPPRVLAVKATLSLGACAKPANGTQDISL